MKNETLIFASVLLISNGVYGKKYIGTSHFVHIWYRWGRENVCPLLLALSVTKKP